MTVSRCRACIDTIKTNIQYTNLEDITILNEENKDKSKLFKALNYGKRIDNIEKGRLSVVIKVHNIFKTAERIQIYVESYLELKKILDNLFHEMSVQNLEEVNFERVDIAIDISESFETIFKKNLYLFELITANSPKNTRWYTTNLDTLERNSIKLKSNSFEVCFYNKEEESGGEFPYKTRLEFRLKRLKGNDPNFAIEKLIDKLSLIDKNIEVITMNIANRLIKKWDKCKNKKRTLTFTSFVADNTDYFYNLEILKIVYKHVGLKASVSSWLKDYRKTNDFEVFSNTQIVKMKKEMIKEIKRYKKS